MQAQQTATLPKRPSVTSGISVAATLVAAILAIAFVSTFKTPVSVNAPAAGVFHQQAPDAVDRNAKLRALQSDGAQSDLTRALPAGSPVTGMLDRNARENDGAQADLTRALPTLKRSALPVHAS